MGRQPTAQAQQVRLHPPRAVAAKYRAMTQRLKHSVWAKNQTAGVRAMNR